MRLTPLALAASAVVVAVSHAQTPAFVSGTDGRQVQVGTISGGIVSPGDVTWTVNGQVVPLPPPPPPPGIAPQNRQLRTGTSRIAGRVVTAGGQPLRQASVRITATELNGVKTATTDQDGRYEVESLPAGRYTVTATKANYLSMNYGQSKPSDIGRSIQLADNQRLDGINITVPRGSVIAGRVVDEFGEPATDIQVLALQKRMSQGQVRLMPAGRSPMTNDIGEFRLYGLSPGQYYVSATSRNVIAGNPNEVQEARTGYAPTYYPNTTNSALAQPITVGLGETMTGIDLQLLTMPLASISGSAIDSQGAPLTRGGVSATMRDGSVTSSFGGSVRPDGTFIIPSLPPGEYLVRAVVPPPPQAARVPGTAAPAPQPMPPPETLIATVTVNGNDVSGVLLTPLKRITVSGRITFDGGSSSANFRSGMVQLMLSPRSPEAAIGLLQPARAIREDLSFDFQVPAAEVLIRANVGSPQWAVKAIRIGGVDITDIGVDLRAGRDVDNVEVVLTSRPAEVSGVVTDGKGEPQQVPVIIFPQERERWMFDTRLISTVRPDQTGRYRLRSLPPGRYLAAATDSSMLASALQDPEVLESLRSRATAFTLADGEAKTVDLRIPAGR